MSLRVYGETNIGLSRKQNEDAIAWHCSSNGNNVVAVLADGMGGRPGGDVASKTAVDICMTQLLPFVEQDHVSITDIIEILNRVVADANSAIRAVREKEQIYARMGTTLLVLWVLGDQAFVANIGDSRCYRLSKSEAKQITKDDTVAQAMVDDGSISANDIHRVPFKNVLTKAVGTESDVIADVQQIFFNSDDALVLCSDGLTGAVNSKEWPSIVTSEHSVQQQVKCLIEASLSNRANDNVSVIMVRRQ
ncbi:PP2C family protein-serine/threonine phosphatase [Alkalimarinus coralli]|uniref:PP2C family protein-serine/threonine phosphatase n=1 Tax=Alkalimarinus coralli TaxID=2935863 RepID=UPI00202AE1A9|nr:protein phosphatase 2C domain-containing protein [Alkalimarinus coralli]